MRIVKVIVELDIPFGLSWNVGGKDRLEVNLNGHMVEIALERQFVNNGAAGSFDNVEITRDREGRSTFTRAYCGLEYTGSKEDDFYINCAFDAVNILLETYRNTYGEFHVDKLRIRDLLNTKCVYLKDDGTAEIKNKISFAGGLTLASRRAVPVECRNALREGRRYPLWKIALNNAKNRHDLEDYPQAIVEANIAFENFAHTIIYVCLSGKVTKEEIDSFLENKTDCNTCKFQPDPNNPEVIIKPYPQSIFKIYYYIHKNKPVTQLSKTKFKVLLENVNQHRNAIMHGREITISKYDSKTAIESMEGIIKIILSEE